MAIKAFESEDGPVIQGTPTEIRSATDNMVLRAAQGSMTKLLEGDGPDDLYRIPEDSVFAGDFLEAPDLERIARRLIESDAAMWHLRSLKVSYLWKRKGGKPKGGPKLAFMWLASGLGKFYSGCDFVLWLAADNLRDLCFTNRQVEALVFHELHHAQIDPDTLKPFAAGHDAELFATDWKYGAWLGGMQLIEDAVRDDGDE